MPYEVKARTIGDDNMPWSAIQYPVIASIKYDGRRTIVHKDDDLIIYETSGGKYFRLENNYPFNLLPNGKYFAEMMGKGIEGKHGDRVHSGIQTSFVTNTRKGIKNYIQPTWRVFAYLSRADYNNGKTSVTYEEMMEYIKYLETLTSTKWVVEYTRIHTEEVLKNFYQEIKLNGWEGLMVAHHGLKWNNTGKSRLKTLAKLKGKGTMKAVCIDVIISEDTKYAGQIGSLLLRLQDGRTFKVGSGLSDSDRVRPHNYFVGNPIEIQYEQLIKGMPQQPVYIDVREIL